MLKGLFSLQPEWFIREMENHEKQLAAIDRRCECLSDKNYEKNAGSMPYARGLENFRFV